jgi:hypothetical protein
MRALENSWKSALLAAGGLCGALFAAVVQAGEADVLAVDVSCEPSPEGRPESICQFSVTVQHEDTGWEHYANRYDLLAVGGGLIAPRILQHPHVDEQPVRRGIRDLVIPHRVKRIKVRAHDSVHGLGGAEVTVDVPHEIETPEKES